MPVKAVFECHDEVTTYLLRMPFRQPGRGNAAGEVLFLAEDVRPVERQLRFFLFEETPRQAHVPHHLVVRAFADIRPIAEGIGGIAPQLDAARHGVVGDCTCYIVDCIRPVQIAAQTDFRVPRFQPYVLVEGRLQAGISTGDVQRVAVVGQGKQVAQGRLPGVPLIGQLHPRLFPAPCHCKIGAVIAGLPDGVCLQHPRLLVKALPQDGMKSRMLWITNTSPCHLY